jgi:BMFP domain-containing protein YqiC
VFDPKSLDDLARRLAESVPAPLRQLQQDMEKNFGAVLQTAFARMNLVTREEFDVQSAVLARSRSRLDALAKQVAELEARLEETQAPVKPTTASTPRRRRAGTSSKTTKKPE